MPRSHGRLGMLASASLATLVAGASVRADFLIYPLGNFKIVLEGTTGREARSITYVHPNKKFDKLNFFQSDVTRIDQVDLRTEYSKSLKRAVADKDADAVFDLVIVAIKRGWVGTDEKRGKFQDALDATLEIDPDHEGALAVQEKLKELSEEVPLEDEKETLKNYVRQNGMNFEESKHFILYHDVPTPKEKRKRSRPLERLDILELVYRTFILYFTARGEDVEVPRTKLMVVLFNEHDNYLNYSKALDPWLVGTAGFYDPIRNVSFFYENSSDDLYKQLRESADEFKGKLTRRSDPRDKQFAALFNLLVEIYREDLDLVVVTHEATHQLAANTGLFPRRVRVPSWVHEGLASFFETPKQATWSGVGAVNDERIAWYNALAEHDREHSSIEFIVGDQIFKYARTNTGTLHAYGQAWALTHFLMDKHFDSLVKYYHLLGDLPPDVMLAPEMHNELFNRVFDKKERDTLDQEWRKHMKIQSENTTEKFVEKALKKQQSAKSASKGRG